MKLPTLVFAFLVAIIFFFIPLVQPLKVNAQTPMQSGQTQVQNQYGNSSAETDSNVPDNLHNYTQSVMIEVLSTVICQLSGVDVMNPTTPCLGLNPQTHKIGYAPSAGGAIGFMGNMIAMTYTPPASSSDYVHYMADNFIGTKKSYAAGFGFEKIQPLQKFWIISRNAVYALFIAVFVIIGFCIMLRVKIDPRTVMTIQNQIPKLIIGLILVTFSFAIAGLLIDIMYVFIYLIFNIFNVALPNLYQSPIGLMNDMIGKGLGSSDIKEGVMRVVINSSVDVGKTVQGMSAGLFNSTIGKTLSDLITIMFVIGSGPAGWATAAGCKTSDMVSSWPVVGGAKDFAGSALGWITDGLFGKATNAICNPGETIVSGVSGIIGGLFGIIAFLIILVALLWALFRLWLKLLLSYINILIDIVLAPFWIGGGLLPGSPGGFTIWLRDMLSNLSVFPATIVMFIMANAFMTTFETNKTTMFVPPLIGNPAGNMSSLIGLGFILTTPKIADMMKKAFKGPNIDLSSIGQALGAGMGYTTNVGKTIGSTQAGANEFRVEKIGPGGQAQYGKVGHGRAFLTKYFRG